MVISLSHKSCSSPRQKLTRILQKNKICTFKFYFFRVFQQDVPNFSSSAYNLCNGCLVSRIQSPITKLFFDMVVFTFRAGISQSCLQPSASLSTPRFLCTFYLKGNFLKSQVKAKLLNNYAIPSNLYLCSKNLVPREKESTRLRN